MRLPTRMASISNIFFNKYRLDFGETDRLVHIGRWHFGFRNLGRELSMNRFCLWVVLWVPQNKPTHAINASNSNLGPSSPAGSYKESIWLAGTEMIRRSNVTISQTRPDVSFALSASWTQVSPKRLHRSDSPRL